MALRCRRVGAVHSIIFDRSTMSARCPPSIQSRPNCCIAASDATGHKRKSLTSRSLLNSSPQQMVGWALSLAVAAATSATKWCAPCGRPASSSPSLQTFLRRHLSDASLRRAFGFLYPRFCHREIGVQNRENREQRSAATGDDLCQPTPRTIRNTD
jgi:hypothetical protein